MVMGTRHDKQDSPFSVASITANLRNSATNVKNRVVGVSVETAGFTNFIRNVPPKLTRMQMTAFNSTIYPDGTVFNVEIAAGQYDIDTLILALRDAFTVAAAPNPFFMGVAKFEEPGQPAHLGFILNASFLGTADGYVSIKREGASLARIIGVNRGEELIVGQYEQTRRKPILTGEQCVYVYSNALAAHRTSLGGHEVSDAIIATIPVTVPYGFVQTIQFQCDAQRPTIVYGPQVPSDLSNIDISFRDADRNVIDLVQGEIFCNVRLWLHTH